MKALLPIVLLLSLVAPANASWLSSELDGDCKDLATWYEAFKKGESWAGGVYEGYILGRIDQILIGKWFDEEYFKFSSNSPEQILNFVGTYAEREARSHDGAKVVCLTKALDYFKNL